MDDDRTEVSLPFEAQGDAAASVVLMGQKLRTAAVVAGDAGAVAIKLEASAGMARELARRLDPPEHSKATQAIAFDEVSSEVDKLVQQVKTRMLINGVLCFWLGAIFAAVIFAARGGL